jgi:predicted RNase H-like nuclease (RuvC/YqgF family)
MLNTQILSDIALEIREVEKRIKGLHLALKEEKEKKEALLKKLDEIMDDAVENYGRKN